MGLMAQYPQLLADLKWHQITNSTNSDLLAELAAGSAGEWSIRIATNQTSGRGRQGRSWETPNGSIAVSIAVPLESFHPSPSWLSAITAIAIKQALTEFLDSSILIKWPNDCFLNQKKFAGILIELGSKNAVVGIGLNLFSAPDIVQTTHLGLIDYLPPFAAVLKSAFDQVMYCSGFTDAQMRDWMIKEIDTIGQDVKVDLVSGESIFGKAIGLTTTGALIVEMATGKLEIHAGDVNHLRPQNA